MDDVTLPLRTERTLVRAMTSDDAAIVVAYRNDPVVAQFQDWELPVSLPATLAAIERAGPGPDVAPGVRTNLVIEVDGVVVGDVFVGIHETGATAEIGFTLAAEHQGRGLATEAADVVVQALFDGIGVHRVHAELDPRNIASQRALERLGLQFEHETAASFFARGEWTGSMGYGADREQYDEWRHRPRSAPDEVRLVELSEANEGRYRRVVTHHSQRRFVDPVLDSMADAQFPEVYDGAPVVPWFRGIEADGEPVGFLMIAETTAHHPEPYLWRLLIGRLHQGRGIGRRAVRLLVEKLRAEGSATLITSWGEGPGSPRPFYEAFGFVPTGEIVDGETEGRLVLPV